MVLMMPSTNVKYNAHIHVHAISGTFDVTIMGTETDGTQISLLDTTLTAGYDFKLSDDDININQGTDNQPLPPGSMVMLTVSGDELPATMWVFVDRCTAPVRSQRAPQ